MNADGTEQVQLTNTDSLPNDFPVYNRNPFWSPNSRKIGFDSNRNGNYEIYLMDANGDNPTNLTQNPAGDIGGSWVLGELAVSPKASSLTSWGKIKTLQGDER
jgi:Tol biopolymer transport system component